MPVKPRKKNAENTEENDFEAFFFSLQNAKNTAA